MTAGAGRPGGKKKISPSGGGEPRVFSRPPPTPPPKPHPPPPPPPPPRARAAAPVAPPPVKSPRRVSPQPRFGRPSQFGGALDPVVDGVFMGALCIGLALGGYIPLWLALVVIARYLLPALAGGLLIALGRRPELRHTLTGQISTVLILVLIGGVCLFRGLNQDPSGLLNAAEIVIPIATVATYVHLAFALRWRVSAPLPG